MAFNKKFLFILISLFLGTHSAIAQASAFNEEWRWVSFTTESGLPSNTVKDIIETEDGTIWAVTSGGLAWYDGFKWHKVEYDAPFRDGVTFWLCPYTADSIFVTVNFQLFVGSKNYYRPLLLYYQNNKIFIDAALPTQTGQIVIIGSLDGFTTQVFLYDGQVQLMQLPRIMLSVDQHMVHFTRNRNIWVNTVDGIYKLDGRQWIQQFPKITTNRFKLPDIIEDRESNAYVCINQPERAMGIWKWENRHTNPKRLLQTESHIRTMDISPDDELLIAYESGEIHLNQNNRSAPITPIPSQLTNLLFLKYRQNGDMWVGTDHGLFLFRHPGFRWTYLKHSSPSLYDNVHEIVQTHNGSLWLATAKGLKIYKPDGAVQYIDQIWDTKIPGVTGLCEDNNHNIWISSGGSFSGVYRWDGRHWKFFGKRNGITTPHIHKIRMDLQGRIWLLGLGEENSSDPPGTYLYSDEKFINWGVQNNFPDQRVYSFGQAPDSTLVFGVRRGIQIFKNQQNIHITPLKDMPNGPTLIFALTIDRKGRIWYVDRDNGLGTYADINKPYFLTTNDGLINNQAWDVNVDTKGTIWISTHGGISNYHDGYFTSFDQTCGLHSLKIWPIYPTKDKLYIGTLGSGVAILDLKEEDNPRPRVEINPPITEDNECLLRWKAFAYWGEVASQNINTRYRLDGASWSSWSTTHEIRLSGLTPGNHLFHVQAKGLFGYYDSLGQQVRFKINYPFYQNPTFIISIILLSSAFLYLILGTYTRKRKHSKEIRESESRLRAVTETITSTIFIYDASFSLLYVNSSAENLTGFSKSHLLEMKFSELLHPSVNINQILPPSVINTDVHSHHNEFRIINRDGSEKWIDGLVGQIDYEHKPAFLCTATDITQRKIAEEKLISYQAILQSLTEELSETEERERRRMATYLHDYIGQSLALSRIKLGSTDDTISSSNLNDIRRHINEVSEHIQSLTFDLSPPVLYELSFEDAIEWLTEQFETEHHLPVSFFHEKHEINISHHLRVLLFHAVRELLYNIVKHAEAYSAKVTLRVIDKQVTITIQDDGKGFDPYTLPDKKAQKGGFGLFNIRERLHHLQGSMSIESQTGKGTMITLRVPLDKPSNEKDNNENQNYYHRRS